MKANINNDLLRLMKLKLNLKHQLIKNYDQYLNDKSLQPNKDNNQNIDILETTKNIRNL